MRQMQETPQSRPFNRRFKRILVSLGEIGVLVLGIGIAYLIEREIERRFFENDLQVQDLYPTNWEYYQPFMVAGIIASFLLFLCVRRKTRPWRLKYNLEGWAIRRAERLRDPRRWKRRRLIQRMLLWIPSATAALALLFYPLIAHAVFYQAGRLIDYRLSLPWNWLGVPENFRPENREVDAFIFSGSKYGFGLAPFWRSDPFAGVASFGCLRTEEVERMHQNYERSSFRAGEIHKEFLTGNTRILCQEDHPPRGSGYECECVVGCLTPIEEKGRAFHAVYRGPCGDLQAFYEVIQRMKPVH
jgi:hypothetical protein